MVSIKLVLIIWLLCSLVSTILYIAFDNDTVTGLLAVGPVGWILSIICFLVNKIHRFFKYHFKKMSIWDDGEGNLYCVTPKMNQDIVHCELAKGYKLVKQYASKSEWKDLETFPDEFLEACLINCRHCVHRDGCDARYERGLSILCKTNEIGCIIEYDCYQFDKTS